MLKILFWILINLSTLTIIMLFSIMQLKKIAIFKEALIFNSSFLGLLLTLMIIDFNNFYEIKNIDFVINIKLLFYSLIIITLPLFSNTLIKKSQFKIPIEIFYGISFFSLILTFIQILINKESIIPFIVTTLFIIVGFYSVSLETFSKISNAKQKNLAYNTVISPINVKIFCILFLIFSPYIILIELYNLEIMGFSNKMILLPTLFLIKNILTFTNTIKYLAIGSYSKINSIEHSTWLKKVNFTKTEEEIIKLYLNGKSNREIATILFKSVETIKSSIKKIYKEADVSSKTELLYFYSKYISMK